MSKHTPEPWGLRNASNATGVIIGGPEREVTGGNKIKSQIASVCMQDWMSFSEKDANALRIVSCVNALAGLTTEQIEDGVFTKMRDDRDSLIKQRDELLAVLQGMIDIANDSQGVAGYHLNGEVADWGEFEEWQAACDAIAKAKGGAS